MLEKAAKLLRKERGLGLIVSYRKNRRGKVGGWKWKWSARVVHESGYTYNRTAKNPEEAINKILITEGIENE